MPQITAVSPANHAVAQAAGLVVTVQFATAIDPATVTDKSFHVLAMWGGSLKGTFAFADGNRTVRFTVTSPLSVGERVRVNLSKGISGTGGPAFYFWEFKTASGRVQNLQITDIKTIDVSATRVQTYGSYSGDLNQDGWHELTIVNEIASDVRVYASDKQGGLVEPPKIYPVQNNTTTQTTPSINEAADFNLDGRVDFAVGAIQQVNQAAGTKVSVFFGDGAGNLALNNTYTVGGIGPTGGGTRGLCALDLNGDNYYDLVSANRVRNNVSILLNSGTGTFGAATNMEATIEGETSCASGDFNEDGREDVAIGGYTGNNLVLLLSNGDGTLQVGNKQTTNTPWMIISGDFDRDGNVDVAAVNNGISSFSLLRGNGQGGLAASESYLVGSNQGSGAGGYASLAIDGGDINGDGYPDIVTSDFGNASWTLYLNDGTGRFGNRMTLRTTRAGSDATFHDRDKDGDLDITGIDEIDDIIKLFNTVGTPLDVNPYRISAPGFRSFRYDPVSKAFLFDLSAPAKMNVVILGSDGRTLKALPAQTYGPGQNSYSLSTRLLPPGVHFYRVNANNHSFDDRLVWLK